MQPNTKKITVTLAALSMTFLLSSCNDSIEEAIPTPEENLSTSIDSETSEDNGHIAGANFTPDSVLSTPRDYTLGLQHTCEIKNEGEVWCFGNNDYGQLGNGTKESSTEPVKAEGVTDAIYLEAGPYSTYAIDKNGDLWAWGNNKEGQLGLGEMMRVDSPKEVNLPDKVKEVSAKNSYYHSAVLLQDGKVMVTGVGDNIAKDGILRTYEETSQDFTGAKDIAVGEINTYVVDGSGKIWGAGENRDNSLSVPEPGMQNGWVEVLDAYDAVKVQAGNSNAIYENSQGELYGWGRNIHGQLGFNSIDAEPITKLRHHEDSKQVEMAASHTVALKKDGTVWVNGQNTNGQLGTNGGDYELTPVQILSLQDVTSIKASHESSSATKESGRYAWGNNGDGALGASSDEDEVRTPQMVEQDN